MEAIDIVGAVIYNGSNTKVADFLEPSLDLESMLAILYPEIGICYAVSTYEVSLRNFMLSFVDYPNIGIRFDELCREPDFCDPRGYLYFERIADGLQTDSARCLISAQVIFGLVLSRMNSSILIDRSRSFKLWQK